MAEDPSPGRDWLPETIPFDPPGAAEAPSPAAGSSSEPAEGTPEPGTPETRLTSSGNQVSPESQAPVPTVLDSAAPMPPDPGPIPVAVADYELLEQLGRGGMGVVYRARQRSLDRIVALKMLLHAEHAGAEERARLRLEAEAIARLQHPHIVQVFEVGEYQGNPFFSMEYVEGGSLDRSLRERPLAAKEAAALVEVLARAMHVAHQKGIVHRDLKPANILLANGGRALAGEDSPPGSRPPFAAFLPKISDFGLAKRLDTAGQTHSGAVMGTPNYMAPEQAAGRAREVGPAVDTWALGAILYECLTSQPPFKAATVTDTLRRVQDDEPASIRRLQPNCPRDLETICQRCLRKDPRRRYATALDLAEDLQRFQRGEPVQCRPVGVLERGWRWCRRNPTAATLLLSLLLLLGGTLAFFAREVQAQARLHAEKEGRLEEAQKALEAENQKTAAELEVVRARRQTDAARAAEKAKEALTHYGRGMQAQQAGDLLGAKLHFARSLSIHDTPEVRKELASTWYTARWLWDVNARPAGSKGGEPGGARAVCISRDGRRVYLGAEDGTVRELEAATGKERASLRVGSPVRVLASHPGEDLIAAGTHDGKVIVLRPATGELVRRFLLGRPISALGYGGSGEILAVGLEGSGLRIIGASDGEQWFRSPPGIHEGTVGAVAFAPRGGEMIWSMGRFLYASDCTRDYLTLIGPQNKRINGVAWSGGDPLLAAAGVDGPIQIYRRNEESARPPAVLLSTRRRERPTVRELTGHRAGVTALAFHPDASTLFSASYDGSIRAWDAREGETVFTLNGHTAAVTALALSRDGRLLTSVGADGRVRTWDVARVHEAPVWKAEDLPQREPPPSPDRPFSGLGGDLAVSSVGTLAGLPGGRLLLGLRDGSVWRWDVKARRGDQLARGKGSHDREGNLLLSPDGRHLAVCTLDFGNKAINDLVGGARGDRLPGRRRGDRRGHPHPGTVGGGLDGTGGSACRRHPRRRGTTVAGGGQAQVCCPGEAVRARRQFAVRSRG